MKLKLTVICVFTLMIAKADWLTPELLWKLGRVSDPQISPDGSKAVYNIRRYDVASNKGNTDIWIYDYSSGKVSGIATDSSNESQPRWSADSKKIFYLNDKGTTQQIWSMNADGGDKQQVSNLSSDVNIFGLSPNDKMIYLVMDVKLDKFLGKDKYSDLPKTSGHVYDDLMMRHWDQWADGNYSHVFVSGFENGKLTGTPVDILKDERYDCPTKPNGGDEEIAWSNDGKQIAYTCIKFSGREYAMNTNSDIYIYDVATSKTSDITSDNKGYDKVPAFSPDGKSIAWISWEEAGNEASLQRLFVMDLATKEKKNLSQGFEYNVENIHWSGKSDKIYFIADINATDQIFSCDPFTKSAKFISQLTNDVADYIALSLTTIGGSDKIIASQMSISAPAELFDVDAKTGKSTQVTFTNKDVLSPLTLGEVKKMMIKTSDGKEMLTWVIYPPNFNPNNKYPTLLYCQGGPQSTVSQFFSYRWNFQLMAANGYIVVAPNRRGLPGFGKKWNDEISNDWGGQAMTDLLSGIDSVAKYPYVNKDKMGAVGASFGGYSVFWLAGHHQKRFKAFISHCGVFDLYSMLGTEELFFHMHEFDGAYWRSPEPSSYQRFSPHKFVQNWDTPIMIISNERDYRIPYSQGLEAFSAARIKNIPAKFLSFPDEGHWVLKPQNSIMWQREFFGWLDKYLK
jgi:dipeptidyl aminopeptidase/acylaminoacyl peptidase